MPPFVRHRLSPGRGCGIRTRPRGWARTTFSAGPAQAVTTAGLYLAQVIVWVKNAFTLGRQDYQWQHEPILYGPVPTGFESLYVTGFLIDDQTCLATIGVWLPM